MKRNHIIYFNPLILGVLMVFAFSACSGSGGKSTRVQIPALMSPGSMTGDAAAQNNEGVDHLVQGHYDVAMKHLKKAIAAKPNFAEAHFNMAVAFDGMGKHGEATASFKKAKEFGKSNQKIVENTLLKKHLNL